MCKEYLVTRMLLLTTQDIHILYQAILKAEFLIALTIWKFVQNGFMLDGGGSRL